MNASAPNPPATPTQTIRRRPAFSVTLAGLLYGAMMLLMGIAAVNSQSNLLFIVFGLMIGVLLVSGTISRFVIRKVTLRRILPEHVVVGERATLQFIFTNKKRFWPSLSISIAELDAAQAFTRQPEAYLLHCAAKMSATLPIDVIPQRRGVYSFNHYQFSTGFPFGFVQRSLTRRQPDSIIVHPALAQVDTRLLSRLASADTSGSSLNPQRGGDDEFYGVKEYRRGETTRRINWRRSARTGILVSNEMTRISPPRLVILLDIFAPAQGQSATADVERAIASAGSLASHASTLGLSVGLVVFDENDEPLRIPPARGKRHLRELLTILAPLPEKSAHDLVQLVEHARPLLTGGASAVVITASPSATPPQGPRSNQWLILSSSSPDAQAWFKFDPIVNFEHCQPLNPTKSISKSRNPKRSPRSRKSTLQPKMEAL